MQPNSSISPLSNTRYASQWSTVNISPHKKWSFPLKIYPAELVKFTEEIVNGNPFCVVFFLDQKTCPQTQAYTHYEIKLYLTTHIFNIKVESHIVLSSYQKYAFLNSLSTNPIKWWNTLNISTTTNKLFERVWPFYGVDAYWVEEITILVLWCFPF